MNLGKFAESESQAEVASLVDSGMTKREAAKRLGISERNVYKMLERIKINAIKRGYSPDHDMTHVVPEGYKVKGISTYYNEDGKPTGQWVKSATDEERRAEALLEAVENAATALPKFKPAKAPKQVDENLASLLTITDFHLGMKAWKDSDGEDWDLKIARNVFLNSIHDMLNASPKSGTGILNQLGDFLHWDGLVQVTPTAGHHLTGDDRYSKLVELSISVMTEAVHLMLKKFGKVVVVQAEGNHDLASSVWMRKFIKHRFEDEPRVEVIDNEFPYYAYQHGDIMLGFHHGHKMKMAQLQKLFASEPRFRKMWGDSNHAYIHCGHLHHERLLDDAGATIEQHPTLAARDNYSSSNGYVSQRGAKVITYDKSEGEVHRVTVRPKHDKNN
ncbi:MAG: winged helix-turn-helix domain-containing protein [Rhodobacteraceae bacterium]|nr:winged helix-turn-helix domain-containing protein [Paracoccaceae bacterium]